VTGTGLAGGFGLAHVPNLDKELREALEEGLRRVCGFTTMVAQRQLSTCKLFLWYFFHSLVDGPHLLVFKHEISDFLQHDVSLSCCVCAVCVMSIGGVLTYLSLTTAGTWKLDALYYTPPHSPK